MQTGRFAPVNRVTQTFLWPGLLHKDRQPNIASLLKEKAGYEVVWKGKWHLSYASNAAMGNGGEDWGPADIDVMEKNWGWSGWNPPDAGNAIQEYQGTPFGNSTDCARSAALSPTTTGAMSAALTRPTARRPRASGGESVVEFLKNRAPKLGKPFCLFVSLVNPHDIGVYPGSWMKPSAWEQAGYRREDFAHLGIKLPSNYADDLSTKPKIQKQARDAYDKQAPLNGAASARGLRELLRLSSHRGRQAHHDRARHAGRDRPHERHHHPCGSPITARAAFRMACARRPTRPTRK